MRINKQQWQWIFYDWANSGYGILVVTAVLPVYFKAVAQQAGVSAADSTAYWGYANSFGTLLVSLLAPLLGVLADYPNAKPLHVRIEHHRLLRRPRASRSRMPTTLIFGVVSGLAYKIQKRI